MSFESVMGANIDRIWPTTDFNTFNTQWRGTVTVNKINTQRPPALMNLCARLLCWWSPEPCPACCWTLRTLASRWRSRWRPGALPGCGSPSSAESCGVWRSWTEQGDGRKMSAPRRIIFKKKNAQKRQSDLEGFWHPERVESSLSQLKPGSRRWWLEGLLLQRSCQPPLLVSYQQLYAPGNHTGNRALC